MHAPSQAKRILAHLQAGGTVTSLSMIHDFDTVDGRKRISELRRMGYPIKDRPGYNENTRKRYNIYYLDTTGEGSPV